jgi:hypothetical protein
MTWHVPAIESEISGSRFPPRRRGVILPRSPRQAWHMRVFRPNDDTAYYLHDLTNENRARSACIRQAPWAPQ